MGFAIAHHPSPKFSRTGRDLLPTPRLSLTGNPTSLSPEEPMPDSSRPNIIFSCTRAGKEKYFWKTPGQAFRTGLYGNRVQGDF